MEEYRKVQRTGESYAVTLPKHWVERHVGGARYVRLTIDGDRVIIEPAQRREERCGSSPSSGC